MPSEPVAYLNGSFVPAREARLAVNDAGFVWGATITDLCRTFHHKLYRWPDHLRRFRHGCAYAGIPSVRTDEEIDALADELVTHNVRLLEPWQELVLVVFATPGPIGYYLGEDGGAGDAAPTFGMQTFPLPFKRYRGLFTEGARLVTPATRHVPPECVDPRVKQRSRLHWWLAEREVRQIDPGASALLVNRDGHVTETAAANFLIVNNGTVISPPRESVLEGVSLLALRDLCGELAIGVSERRLSLDDCFAADEALVTSTPYCVAGVSRLNGQAIPWPGRVLERVLTAWNGKVGLDIRAQILAS
jgi:branched-chain amino acid aminotransferase